MVANGPDTPAVKSSTRTPLSGPDMKISLTGLARDCGLFGVCCQPWEFRGAARLRLPSRRARRQAAFERGRGRPLSSVVLVRLHRKQPLVVAMRVSAVGLRR